MSGAENGTASEAKSAKTKRFYLKSGAAYDGVPAGTTRDPREADGIRIEFPGFPGTPNFEARADTYPEGALNGMMWFGCHTLLTNAMGGKDGEEAVEAFMSRHETLTRGEWSDRKGGDGPRVGQLAQAIVAFREKAGNPADLQKVTDWLVKQTPAQRKAVQEEPGIAVELARIQQEAAAAKLKAAREKAKEAGKGESAVASMSFE